jgi:hypothetical protein
VSDKTKDALREAYCPICGHEWSQHDPADGCCDAHSSERLGVCQCGRDMAWMHGKIAALSRAALAASSTAAEPVGRIVEKRDRAPMVLGCGCPPARCDCESAAVGDTPPLLLVHADADYILRWLRQSNAPANIRGLQERVVAILAATLVGDTPPQPDEAEAVVEEMAAMSLTSLTILDWGNGRPGVITSSAGHRIRVRLDGEKHSGYWHPTWHMDYLVENS